MRLFSYARVSNSQQSLDIPYQDITKFCQRRVDLITVNQ